ncbi:hypothetical protein Poly21_06610 [Allorhodopirellula heiligendammensis]|uniref:Uncharacterized protein n=1 Tax=Allorhodopirellula heiligendammensis TaxID=2714739 RepID=A0A5C6C2Z6_9BACT|nr:hypothetical protein Poly21_06610 [Allorhodopirellula heiligendammensis]
MMFFMVGERRALDSSLVFQRFELGAAWRISMLGNSRARN